jgi:hypothetical protein
MFAIVFALLVLDSRAPSRRVYAVLPLLALWGNLHGSVVLGAALAGLHGLMLLRARTTRLRGAVLTIATPLMLVASPYGLDLVAYYRLMLVQSPLPAYVQEWGPVTVDGTTAIFLASAFGACLLYGRHRRVLTPLEQLALPLLLVAALLAIRNTIWFELALVVALPRLLDAVWPSRIVLTERLRRINLSLAVGCLALAGLSASFVLTRPATWFSASWPARDAAVVAAAAGSDGLVLADDRHSDWLLWEQPRLVGRIAHDIRFELMTRDQLASLSRLRAGSRPRWSRCGPSFAVLTFGDESHWHLALEDGGMASHARTVIRKPALYVVRSEPRPAARALAAAAAACRD